MEGFFPWGGPGEGGGAQGGHMESDGLADSAGLTIPPEGKKQV